MENPNASFLKKGIEYKSQNALETDLVLSKKDVLIGRMNEHEEEEINPHQEEEEINPHQELEIDEALDAEEKVGPSNESEENNPVVSYVLGGAVAPSNNENLAVAVAVPDLTPEEPGLIFFAHEVDLDDAVPLYKSKTFWFCASIVIIIVIAAAIGSTLATTKALEESIRYTNAPSVSASSSPSTSRDGLGIWQRLDQVSNVDLMLALDTDARDDDTLNTVNEIRNTPQFLAANWIINEDFRQVAYNDPTLLQRFALAVIYFSTYGENWTSTQEFYNTSNATYDFLNDEDECTWFGVICPSDSTLTGLLLGGNELSGTIPEEIGVLDQLTMLDLSGNYLYGTIPESIGALVQMTAMSLADNYLSGHIPESYYNLIQMDTFELLYNYLSGTISDSISTWENLKGLYLEKNFFSGTLPESIGDLEQLSKLSFFVITLLRSLLLIFFMYFLVFVCRIF